MATADLNRFKELLNSDMEFREKLRKRAEEYTGEPDDKSVFEGVLLPIGKEYGLSATYEEFISFAGDLNGEEGELSEEELAQVAGGKGLCFVVGGSNDAEVEASSHRLGVEAHACYYAGIGMMIPSAFRKKYK